MSTPLSAETLRDPAADQHMTAGRAAFGADQWAGAIEKFSAALALGHPEAKAWLANSKAKLRIHEKRGESERKRDDATERKGEASEDRVVQVTVGGKTVGVPMSRLRDAIPTTGSYGADTRTRSGREEKTAISGDDEDDDVEIDFVRRQPLVTAPTANPSPPPSTVPPRLADKTRFSAYQTAEEFTLDFFVKDTHRDDVRVEILADSVLINIYYPADKSEYSREFKLAAKIDHEASLVRHGAIKIEIVLRKWRAGTWPALERTETRLPLESSERKTVAVVERPHVIADVPPSYPTSCRKKRDWDGLGLEAKQEEESEKKDGDAGLQHLFQSIYAGGDEDSRRAMIKSYQTSGGTVLSTNWKEVATKDYEKEIEAPKGQEVRRWNS